MIVISEIQSIKCPGETSLRIDFEYDPRIIEIIKQAGDAVWSKKLKMWECPVSKLGFLIDSLTFLDDITLNILPEEDKVTYDLTLNYKTKPFNYQLEGIKWMLNNPDCLLLDEPGLGKSIQTIYLAEELKAQESYEHCLIICGINSLKNNWKKEVLKHSRESCVIIGERISKKGRVTYASIEDRAQQLYNYIDEYFVIINVESLRYDIVIDAILNSKNKFDLILVDETHKFGNPTTLQTKNFLKLAKIGKRHVGMTGTLLTNSPLNAFIPLKFIGKERGTWTNFKNYYCNLEQVFGHMDVVGYKNMDILKHEIDSCSIRRKKDEVLELPPKIIIPEFIDMDTEQSKFYENIMEGIVDSIDKVHISTGNLLGMIVRLRQATSSPSVLTTKNIASTKLERACALVEEIVSSGEKVVIFSEFKEPLYILAEKLTQYNPLIGTGDLDDKLVSDNIDRFQNEDKYKVFLGTAKKMGTGITLTAASYAIFIDTPWTYSDFNQACDRVHRIGANKPVIIYDLICNKTIDERVWEIINTKKDMSDYMIDGEVNNKELLEQLLGLSL